MASATLTSASRPSSGKGSLRLWLADPGGQGTVVEAGDFWVSLLRGPPITRALLFGVHVRPLIFLNPHILPTGTVAKYNRSQKVGT